MELIGISIMISSLLFSVVLVIVRIMTYKERMFKLESKWVKGESYDDILNIVINAKGPIPESEMNDLVKRAIKAQERQECP